MVNVPVNRIPGFFSGIARSPKIANAARIAKRASVAAAKDLIRVKGAGIMAGSMAIGGTVGYFGSDGRTSGAVKGAMVGGVIGLGGVAAASRGFRRNMTLAGRATRAGFDEATAFEFGEGPRLKNGARSMSRKAPNPVAAANVPVAPVAAAPAAAVDYAIPRSADGFRPGWEMRAEASWDARIARESGAQLIGPPRPRGKGIVNFMGRR